MSKTDLYYIGEVPKTRIYDILPGYSTYHMYVTMNRYQKTNELIHELVSLYGKIIRFRTTTILVFNQVTVYLYHEDNYPSSWDGDLYLATYIPPWFHEKPWKGNVYMSCATITMKPDHPMLICQDHGKDNCPVFNPEIDYDLCMDYD